MDHPDSIAYIVMGNSIGLNRVNVSDYARPD